MKLIFKRKAKQGKTQGILKFYSKAFLLRIQLGHLNMRIIKNLILYTDCT